MSKLTTLQLTRAALEAERLPQLLETIRQAAELHERVKVFEAVVWFPHLQAQVNGTDERGLEGHCRGIRVLTWCCAGRCLIQLEQGGATLTLITAEDEAPWQREMAHIAPGMGPMGIQGIDAGYMDALVMLYLATRHGSEIRLVPAPDVGPAFSRE